MWRKILIDIIQSMLNLAVDKYAGVLGKVSEKNDKKAEQFVGQKPKQKFEEASVVK